MTRSPGDPWHSEEYLLLCLIRTHGWGWDGPGRLRRAWQPQRRTVVITEGAA